MLYKFKPITIKVGVLETGNIKKAVESAKQTKAQSILFTWNSNSISAHELLDYLKSGMYGWVGLYGCNYKWEITDDGIVMKNSSDIPNCPIIL